MSTLAEALGRRFLARTDAWVTQGANGRYRAHRGQLEADALRDHLAARQSLCAYALAPGPEGATALWGAFDLDAHGEEPAATPPPDDGRGRPVRCLFPEAHAHGDRPPGSAYLIRRGDTQLFGCSVCEGGRAWTPSP